ncbi:MAG: sigma 54-interacting transcriptional regulator [Proteobacteria bacterium]|uniref:sigma 54-interacting transcriptional regulator n=1 Tax=Aquabacterium sp. TaxID=1872578 RepID=UPI0035C683A8|nr:sigma 54-interacting transcriptional regulator [Pseudomonadota bacterium]
MPHRHKEAVPHGALPTREDLIQRIHFDPREGRIWLDDQRMLLLHTSALGVLRQELIDSLGVDAARGLITRMGYNSGAHDAELARKMRAPDAPQDALFIGPQLHMLEGVARVEPAHLEIDEERGHFFGEFHWYGCAEAEVHVQRYGIGADTACWQQVGYASGFVSRFMGRPVMFREVQCCAQGASHCVIIGKSVDEWSDADEDKRSLRADALTQGLSAVSSERGDNASARSLLGDAEVVGVSSGFNAVCHMVRRAANTQATVLFLGESGVGKEVLAQSLHRISQRASGPFVAINCAAIPDDLIESELFGVEKGGFTGAQSSRAGRFERADGGTLFLDEIGILSWTAQGKLLRALQEREIERVGGIQTRKVDVRVVAATNLDLRAEVEAGRFREDLFFRLNVLPIRVPPLRERREDIPVFMNHFLRKFNQRDGRSVSGFTARAIDAMLSYGWPGNIRELENLVERGVVLAGDGGAIDVSHLFVGGEHLQGDWLSWQPDGSLQCRAPQASAPANPASMALAERVQSMLGDADCHDGLVLDEVEAALIRRAMQRTQGNQSAAARLLGLTRAQLIYRLKTVAGEDSA